MVPTLRYGACRHSVDPFSEGGYRGRVSTVTQVCLVWPVTAHLHGRKVLRLDIQTFLRKTLNCSFHL